MFGRPNEFEFSLSNTSGSPEIDSATVFSGVSLDSGAVIALDDAAVVSGVTVSIGLGATASSLNIQSGGVVRGPGVLEGYCFVEGEISGVRVALGNVELTDGATGRDLTVSGGSNQIDILSGAVVSDILALNQAELFLDVGGSGVRTVLSSASEYLNNGAVSRDDVVANGGLEEVYVGVARDVHVESGGTLIVRSGGSAAGSQVARGGVAEFDPSSTLSVGRVTSTTVFDGVTLSSGAIISAASALPETVGMAMRMTQAMAVVAPSNAAATESLASSANASPLLAATATQSAAGHSPG